MINKIFLTFLLFMGSIPLLFAQDSKKSENDYLYNIADNAYETLTEQEILKTVKNCDASVTELINKFHQVKDKKIKACILFALGEMRSEKAIPLLISNINFEPVDFTTKLPKYPEPASIALSKIGIPAIKPVLKAIKLNSNKEKAAYFAYAIIEMGYPELAIFLLEKEIKNTVSKHGVDQLKFVLSIIKKHYLRKLKAKK